MRTWFVILLLATPGLAAVGGERPESGVGSADGTGFQFTDETRLAATPVKNQANTGTCWAFATVSFLESELMRMGKGTQDLSEMFLVRHVYPEKAESYVRWHGKKNFGPGSLAGDALRAVGRYGVVPESIYEGQRFGEARHDHAEMDRVLRALLDAVLDTSGSPIKPAWPAAVTGVLDAYLGAPPAAFEWQGKQRTPLGYARSLGLKEADYLHLTSYSHHPFRAECTLELPDNWAGNRYWNIPLNQLMRCMDHALKSGFTVIWDGDVSEASFKRRHGVALLPLKEWESRSPEEKEALGAAPEAERVVTQELRQQLFDSQSSTDDHLMHVVGTSRDQHGTRYYLAKNSWGASDNDAGGFVRMSTAYTRAKTISITLHRAAVPPKLLARLQRSDRGAKKPDTDSTGHGEDDS